MLSVVVPWFFFMPAMGAGLMGRKTPRPLALSISALVVHSVFGVSIALLLGWISKS
jgi:hypothetical protein